MNSHGLRGDKVNLPPWERGIVAKSGIPKVGQSLTEMAGLDQRSRPRWTRPPPITTRPQSATIIDGLTFNFLLYVIGSYQKFGFGIGLTFVGKREHPDFLPLSSVTSKIDLS
jgi:hypothetical protein